MNRVIIADSIQQVSKSTLHLLPSYRALSRSISKVRKEINIFPEPRSLGELIIPEEYKTMTLQQEQTPILLYDSFNEDQKANERILVFSTPELLKIFKNHNSWYADGTFDSSPALFYQIYTIHALVGEKTIPCIFAMLPSKSERVYLKLFRWIQDYDKQIKPNFVLIDFEIAAKKALEKVFVGVLVNGCYFHFSQCLQRKLQKLGLKNLYEENACFRNRIKFLKALAFVPEYDIIKIYQELISVHLVDDEDDQPDFLEFLDYFEKTWVSSDPFDPGEPQAKYPLSWWNCYELVINSQPKTNNALEAWNRHFSKQLKKKPSFWKSVDAIKKEITISLLNASQFGSSKSYSIRREDKIRAERLKNQVEKYMKVMDFMDYLTDLIYYL